MVTCLVEFIIMSKHQFLYVLTSPQDAVELLEKRVKSRFSHKTIELHSDSFEEYVKVFKTLLSLPDDFEDHKFLREWSEHLEVL